MEMDRPAPLGDEDTHQEERVTWTPQDTPPDMDGLWKEVVQSRMDIAELKGMVKMHFTDSSHHTPPCSTASGLQKTLHAAMGAAIISLLSAVATLVFEVVKGIAQ